MQEANITAIAKEYMGEPAPAIAWFAGAIVAAYGFSFYAAVAGTWPLWVSFLVGSYLAFMAYTPLHESVHHNICGRNKQTKWLNDLVGYLVSSVIGFSFHVHKWAHRVHHQSTNVPGVDPDHIFNGSVTRDALLGGVLLVANEYRLFFRNAFPKLDTRRRFWVLLEIGVMIGWRFALGIWLGAEVLLLTVVANVVGVTWLVIIFAWIVHVPFEETERYKDTSTYILPKTLRKLGTWFWLWQNYHGIHHLFPRIPFYKYDQVYERIEEGMRERGSPILPIG
ncbi:MAG: fatty acid desaturase [Pseudomonadota bacterium]